MRLIDGYIPEDTIINSYVGKHRPKFEDTYVTINPDHLALLWRTDKDLPKDFVEARGLGRMYIYYDSSKESIVVLIRIIDACGEWWRWRTFIHLADTNGHDRVQKIIELFEGRVPARSLRYGTERWVRYYTGK